MNSRMAHLCQRISNVRTPEEKKSKYLMLHLIRQVSKVVEICRFQLRTGKGMDKLQRPADCGLSSKEYHLLQKHLKESVEPIEQLRQSLMIIIGLELSDTFRMKLWNNVLHLVRGKLK